MLKKLDKIMCIVEDGIISLGIITAALILFMNVILRYFFKSGIVWAEEFTRYTIIWITFIGGSVAVRHNAHLRVTAALEVLSEKKGRILNLIVQFISIAFTTFITIYGWKLTMQYKATNQLTPSMEIPTYWVYIAIPLGGLLMTIRLLQVVWKELKGNSSEENISGKELA
ncbi:TRAP transporter small permease [Natronincola ferrireducens]|uniref:C4-dicarboxylate transporter, DctQ subunit n=1 Tax=Natronincola ferrireducens TaxID=393762 RepID=A0A1G9G1Q0_9FIRM|nr:TRAP transporter small permease [Natronincola ferrireducens]SDK94537.1 C4-dicarboxylate transporter, DctQ subunit [Natronincola ferrireducens]